MNKFIIIFLSLFISKVYGVFPWDPYVTYGNGTWIEINSGMDGLLVRSFYSHDAVNWYPGGYFGIFLPRNMAL